MILRATAAFDVTCGCVLYVGTNQRASAEDWDAYLQFLAPLLRSDRATPRIVWDNSGGPDALGRRKLAELTKSIPVKVALITQSDTGRGAAIALNWKHGYEAYKTFTAGELNTAAAFVGVSESNRVTVLGSLMRLRARLQNSGQWTGD